MTGTRASGNVMLASGDRIAIDATGLACLKHLGANKEISEPAIFSQEQIKRAVNLGLGVSSAKEIQLVAADDASRAYAEAVRKILLEN